MRKRFRFSHRAGGRYYWHSALPVSPGDSRHEEVSCPVSWFQGQTPAWLAYAGVPLNQIPDDGQREETRRRREETQS